MDKAADVLQGLADKLGVTVQYLWPYLVHKTVIDWWAAMAGWTAGLCISSIVLLLSYRLAKRQEWEPDPNPVWIPGVFVGGGVAVLCVVFALTQLSLISQALVPEAATIERILQLARR